MENRPILYVEDDDNDVFLFRKAFSKTGHLNPIHIASDGVCAVEFLRGEREYGDRQFHPLPHLVMID